MVPGVELSFAVLLDLYIHGIEVAIDIINTQVPDTFMTMLRGMMEIEPDIEPVIGWQRKIIRTLIDKLIVSVVRGGAAGDSRCIDPLCRDGNMITRMITPVCKGSNFRSDLPTDRKVQFVTVVEFVIIPVRIEVIIFPLVPGQRIRSLQLQVI